MGFVIQRPFTTAGLLQFGRASPSQNLQFNITYGPHWVSVPAGLQSGLNSALNWVQSNIFVPVTIHLNIDYGYVGNAQMSGATGETVVGSAQVSATNFSYAQVRSALVNNARSPIAQQAITNSFPSSDPTGGATIGLNPAHARILGLLGPWPAGMNGTPTDPDAYHGFEVTSDWFDGSQITQGTGTDAFAVCLHEITEGLGRMKTNYFFGSFAYPLALLTYTSAGTVQTGLFYNSQGYFSLDGGTTNLMNFNKNSAGDSMDWDGTVNDCFQAVAVAGTQPFSTVDQHLLDAIGMPSIP